MNSALIVFLALCTVSVSAQEQNITACEFQEVTINCNPLYQGDISCTSYPANVTIVTDYSNYTQDRTKFTFHKVSRNLTFATCICPSNGNNYTYYFNIMYDRYIYIESPHSSYYFLIIVGLCALNFVTLVGLMCVVCRRRDRISYRKRRINGV
ncbi:ORF55A [Duck adenovirus 3]|uniref:ORF55A n=3 Tax=Duck aviadenovirus B TaxID=1534553 RepID=A0A7D5BIE4_9ADEN|nr:ORF55A [Duck adenovirus 2]AYH52305.1 ORF55A [Duck adenovirus 3]QKW89997.1 ORF55A [Duck aviadenovirus B]QKX94128.1 ORF55A [Duck aviadenovirus B]UIY90333.1 ORF55A [Duck adenovirus 3]